MNKTLKWTLYGFATSSLIGLFSYLLEVYMNNEIGFILILFFNLPFGALAYFTPFGEMVIFLGSLIFNWTIMGGIYGAFISGSSRKRKLIFFMGYLFSVLLIIFLAIVDSSNDYMEMMEGGSSQQQNSEQ